VTGAAKTLTKAEHFILCPPTLGCFHIGSQRGYEINMEKLNPVKWPTDAMERVVLAEDKKNRLKCLVKRYTGDGVEGGDIIRNKGLGLTFVFYGPSGVGKTLTAECLADYVERPLIPLSVGNLVADEDSIDFRLSEAFNNASRLKAILLLDEADVVLEARSFEDVRRNGIVSRKWAPQPKKAMLT
jgi:AAA+ superfamily predicted ATPase